jgi:hypothetical protein
MTLIAVLPLIELNSPHGLHGNWLEDVLAAADTHAEATVGQRELGQLNHHKELLVCM